MPTKPSKQVEKLLLEREQLEEKIRELDPNAILVYEMMRLGYDKKTILDSADGSPVKYPIRELIELRQFKYAQGDFMILPWKAGAKSPLKDGIYIVELEFSPGMSTDKETKLCERWYDKADDTWTDRNFEPLQDEKVVKWTRLPVLQD